MARRGTALQPLPLHFVESPPDVVQRRYTNGDIDREEYQQKLKDL